MRQTHKRKIICSLKGKEISFTSASRAVGCRGAGGQGGRGPNKFHFHIYIQAVEINLKSRRGKKEETKLGENIKRGACRTLKSTGPQLSPCVWNAHFFLALLLNGAWHFHYSRKLNWLIFLQAPYVCYFREARWTERLFQHLHKSYANVDVQSDFFLEICSFNVKVFWFLYRFYA